MIRLFDFECVECGTKFESLYCDGDNVHCKLCNSTLVEKLPPIVNIAMGAAGAHGYYDETLDTYVRTNAHRKELMREHGITEKGSTPKPTGDAWV